jgi:hypothetical protein
MHSVKKWVLLLVPFLVPLSTYILFVSFPGSHPLAFLGNTLYWIFWCLLIPWFILGRIKLFSLLHPKTLLIPKPFSVFHAIAFLLPIFIGFMVLIPGVLPPELKELNINAHPIATIFLILLISLWNGTLEEILWRGAYGGFFKNNLFLSFIYPSIGFGLWHLSPYGALSGFRSEVFLFTAGGMVFGFCWGWLAWKTKSIRLSVLSHIGSNIALMSCLVFL